MKQYPAPHEWRRIVEDLGNEMKRLGIYLTLLFSIIVTGNCVRWSDPFISLLCRKERIHQYRLYQQWILEDQERGLNLKGGYNGSKSKRGDAQ